MRSRDVAFVLALMAVGCTGHVARPEAYVARARGPVVQLVRARLPMPLEIIAVHYWFNAYDPTTHTWERWEVWQDRERCATSWGHVHRDLQSPWSNVGGGDAIVEKEWTDEDAARLVATLHRPLDYPDRDTYRAWPGPNSNTYVAWVLREANASADLGPLAIGRDWRGWIGGGVTTTGSGLHVSTPLVGLKVGALDGIEVQVFAFTFGFAAFPPAVKTPFGAIGLPD